MSRRKFYNPHEQDSSMKWFVFICVLLLLIGCGGHVDRETSSFVDREDYVRPELRPAPPAENHTNTTAVPTS
jgi:hypothetical protein